MEKEEKRIRSLIRDVSFKGETMVLRLDFFAVLCKPKFVEVRCKWMKNIFCGIGKKVELPKEIQEVLIEAFQPGFTKSGRYQTPRRSKTDPATNMVRDWFVTERPLEEHPQWLKYVKYEVETV